MVLVIMASGCSDLPLLSKRTPDLPGDPGSSDVSAHRPLPHVTCAPASGEAAARVGKVGQQLIDKNRQYGIQPLFMTAGLPDPEILHQGTGLIIVTESLVSQCATDAQLAAVLGVEIGKIVAERESQEGGRRRLRERPEAMSVARNSTFPTTGSPDRTEVAEMVKMYGDRPAAPATVDLPNPEVIARNCLKKAGFEEREVEGVRELLKAADANTELHKQYTMPAGR
jgi:hypothetical protein